MLVPDNKIISPVYSWHIVFEADDLPATLIQEVSHSHSDLKVGQRAPPVSHYSKALGNDSFLMCKKCNITPDMREVIPWIFSSLVFPDASMQRIARHIMQQRCICNEHAIDTPFSLLH
jgi:hypothetical protein